MRTGFFHSSSCCLMRPHNKNISLWSSSADKVLWLSGFENFLVLKALPEHILHHGIKVHAYLSRALHVVILLLLILLILHFFHHLPLVALCNGRYLKSHIGFVDGNHILHQISKLTYHVFAITGKRIHSRLVFPSTISNHPYW